MCVTWGWYARWGGTRIWGAAVLLGTCEVRPPRGLGSTYARVREQYPFIEELRKKDKYSFRYPEVWFAQIHSSIWHHPFVASSRIFPLFCSRLPHIASHFGQNQPQYFFLGPGKVCGPHFLAYFRIFPHSSK